MELKNYIFIVLFFSIITFSCSERKVNDFQINQKLEGCWVGGLLKNGNLTEDMELRFLKVKSDSALVLSLIYELGPRSSVLGI